VIKIPEAITVVYVSGSAAFFVVVPESVMVLGVDPSVMVREGVQVPGIKPKREHPQKASNSNKPGTSFIESRERV